MFNATKATPAASERLAEVVVAAAELSNTASQKIGAVYSCHQRLGLTQSKLVAAAIQLLLLCTYTIMISSAVSVTTTQFTPTNSPSLLGLALEGQEGGSDELVPLQPLTHQSEASPQNISKNNAEQNSIEPQQPKYLILDQDDTSPGSVIEYADNNEIQFGVMDASSSSSSSSSTADSPKPVDEASLAFLDSLGSKGKNRRHADYQIKTADWWTQVSKVKPAPITLQQETKRPVAGQVKGRPSTKTSSFGQASNRKSPGPKGFVYKEQPLKQNEIVTLKYQLKAIRSMQKSLVTKPMSQLQKLDNRLVDSYKLCLKKKMPLYAGMLYRTRDFVVRMAKEVKQERKILDGMAKQVQMVLRERTANHTLVRDFNRIMANPFEANVDVRTIETVLGLSKNVIPRVRKNVGQHSTKQANDFDSTTQRAQLATDETETRRPINSFGKTNLAKRQPGKNLVAPKGYPTATKTTDKDGADDVTRKPSVKQGVRYTVNVNEVNLKRELTKTQQLIDRIDASCHDLTGVIDDIIYLFKLTTDDTQTGRNKQGKPNKMDKFLRQIASSSDNGLMDSKQGKKLLKSPIRVLFERYGRLTMEPATSLPPPVASYGNSVALTTPSGNLSSTTGVIATTTIAPPPQPSELKPLFDPSSLVYVEPRDVDLGWEVSSPIDPDSSF